MFEVISEKKKGNKIFVTVVDDKTGKMLSFGFPKNVYSEEFLIEKIKRSKKTGISKIGEIEEDILDNLVGKKLNMSKGVFE